VPLATDRSRRAGRAKLGLPALACLILTFGFAVAAFAQDGEADEPGSARSGPYLGLSVAGALPNFAGSDMFVNTSPTRPSVQEEPSVGLNARAGWRIFSFLAAEAQYEWIDEWRIKTRDVTCVTADAQVVTGNLRLLVPFRTVHPYLLAGVGAGHFESKVTGKSLGAGFACEPAAGEGSSESEWGLVGRFGGGFDIYLSPHLVVNLETTTLYSEEDEVLGDSNWPYVSISGGFQYRF
jgi:opacity protein-like surface antigen